MSKHNNGANDVIQSHKDIEILAVYELLQVIPSTATEAAVKLKIYRPNLCRYKKMLQDAGKLAELKKVRCTVTRRLAWQLTANPSLFTTSPQLKMFENG